MKTKTKRSGQRGKSIEERVGYALSHRIRVGIQILLVEGVYTADEIASIVGESRQAVHHHLRELLDAGSIEIAKVEKRRNADLFYYRGIEGAEASEEELAAMSIEQRQALSGQIIQQASAEAMAALGAGKLSNDPKLCLVWTWFNLDRQGRLEMAEEQVRWWERAQEIAAESASRRAESGEEATSYVVSLWGFERARMAPDPPSASADKRADPF